MAAEPLLIHIDTSKVTEINRWIYTVTHSGKLRPFIRVS